MRTLSAARASSAIPRVRLLGMAPTSTHPHQPDRKGEIPHEHCRHIERTCHHVVCRGAHPHLHRPRRHLRLPRLSDPRAEYPVIFFVHLAATLDNWDPRIIDPVARDHHVITFDNRGVGASTGKVPDSIEAMADDAVTFIEALGFDKVDIFSFSLGGMVAQALVVKHPDLVRKLILTGTGPRRWQGHRQGRRSHLLRHAAGDPDPADPKEFLFFNRNTPGKRAAKAFVERLKDRTVDRDAPITVKAFRAQLKAIKKWGRSAPADLSKITQPTLIANGDNDRMVASVLSEDMPHRIRCSSSVGFCGRVEPGSAVVSSRRGWYEAPVAPRDPWGDSPHSFEAIRSSSAAARTGMPSTSRLRARPTSWS